MKELEVRKFLDVIKPDGELFEIRVIDGRWVSVDTLPIVKLLMML